jgi:predicted nucleic acid-binding protein
MSARIFVDTLFVIALVNQRDDHHRKASELADLCEGQSLITTDTVLMEIANALARNFKSQAIEIIEDFLASVEVMVVRLDQKLFDRVFALYKQYQDKEWGLTDCVSFLVMREAGITDALTFDQHFVQAGFRALMRD